MKKQNTVCHIFKLLTLGALTLLISACAFKEDIIFQSTPSNANVVLSSGQKGTTPISFALPRNKEYVAVIEKVGYEAVTVNITKRKQRSEDLFFRVLLGSDATFLMDGSEEPKTFTPNPVSVELKPVRATQKLASTEPVSATNEG